MSQQAGEEPAHAQKFNRQLTGRGGPVGLAAVGAPQANMESPLQAVNAVRDMERATTESIHRLFQAAREEGDYALEVLLHWYITEQVEEEQWAEELAAMVKQFHDRPGQLFMLDHQW